MSYITATHIQLLSWLKVAYPEEWHVTIVDVKKYSQ